MESDLWRVLWKTKVPLKVLHFVWKAISGCLSTNLQLHSKHVPVQLQCMFCSREEESIMHSQNDWLWNKKIHVAADVVLFTHCP
ncbi:hypothetical protein F8388_020126 [Cannabis sativa]|uniref:Reverse transcriptase zinc-binding domain-containing protein n=1 Tax=Cannabis sativa TaxID=3483 RepID=A0A7J6FLC5_CANSA|nr:hypothetical protein F8388_020126 [Cannabis sativa]